MNLAILAEDDLARSGDRPIVLARGRWWTSGELHEDSCRLATALIAHGVAPGERVLILLPTGREALVAAAATWRAGAIVVHADPATPAVELQHRLIPLVEPTAIIAGLPAAGELVANARLRLWADDPAPAGQLSLAAAIAAHDPLAAAIARDSEDPAQLVFTGGTTGVTKAAIYAHGGMRAWLTGDHTITAPDTAPETLITALPPTAFGGLPLLGRWTRNIRLVLEDRFDPRRMLALIESERVTRLQLVPSMAEALLALPEIDSTDLSSLRIIAVGGAPATPALLDDIERKLGIRPANAYGMTEAGGGIAIGRARAGSGAIGPVTRGVKVRIVDHDGADLPRGVTGELAIRSPWMARGYWNDPEQTAATFRGGWLYTGDLGVVDADGVLSVVGRKKEIIIQAGFNIAPQEVIEVLRLQPEIADCAVIGVPHTLLGEEAVACVVVRTGATIDEAAIASHCRIHLDPRKVPGRVRVLDRLPRTAAGKVRRRELIAAIAEVPPGGDTELARELAAIEPGRRRDALLGVIAGELHRMLPGLPDDIDPDAELTRLGVGSLDGSRLVRALGELIGRPLAPTAALRHPTPAALAAHLQEELSRGPAHALVLGPLGVTEARASVGQHYFWYLQDGDPDPTAYGTQWVMRLDGRLDRDALARSLEGIVARHSVLRTRFELRDGDLHQIVADDAPFEVVSIDRDQPTAPAWQDEIDRVVDDLLATGFDLARGRNILAAIVRFAPDRHALVLIPHHIAVDAASWPPFLRQTFAAYRRLVAGEPAFLPGEPAPLAFIDYAESVHRWYAGPGGEPARRYWRQQLAGAPPLVLPSDLPRDDVDAGRDAARFGLTPEPMLFPYFSAPIPRDVVAQVLARAQAQGTTAYVVYLAGLAWLFHSLTGQDDICIESTFSPRIAHGVPDDTIGLFASWLLMRIDVAGADSLDGAIARTAQVVASAYEHGVFYDYYTEVPTSVRRATFNYVPIPEPAGTIPLADGLSGTSIARPWPRWRRPWEIHMTMLDSPERTLLFMTASERLYRRDTIDRLLARYLEILA